MKAVLSIVTILAVLPLRGQILDIRLDGTSSIPHEARSFAITTLNQQLPELVRMLKPKIIRVSQFGNDPWMSPGKDFAVPALDALTCASPRIPAEIESIQSLKEAMIRRAEEACRESHARARQRHEVALSNVVMAVQAAMLAFPTRNYQCTAVGDLLALIAMAHEPTTFIVITDAQETCGHLARQNITQPHPDVRVAFLITPSVQDLTQRKSMAISFAEAKRTVHTVAPWVRMQPMSVGNIAGLLQEPTLAAQAK